MNITRFPLISDEHTRLNKIDVFNDSELRVCDSYFCNYKSQNDWVHFEDESIKNVD